MFRPSQKINFVPGIGIHVITPQSAATAAAWWLSGGINPANVVAAYRAKGAASYASSLVNLAQPGTYDAYAGTDPAWNVATGWTFTAGTLLTGIIPAVGWSMICRFANVSGTGTYCHTFYCQGTGDTRFFLPPKLYADHWYGNGGYLLRSGVLTSGVMAIAGYTCYKNGVSDGTITTPWSGTGVALTIGLVSAGNSIDIIAGSVYNTILSFEQQLAVYAAIIAL